MMSIEFTTPSRRYIVESYGNGWAYNVKDQETGYSYQRGEWAYLEEDCDASKYFDALKRTGQPIPKIVDKICREKRSKVRSYDHYVTPEAKWNKFVKDHFVVINVA